MNDTQIRDTLHSVIEKLTPIVNDALSTTMFHEMGDELAGCVILLDSCKLSLSERIASAGRHPSRVRIIDDQSLDTVTLEDGRERPMLQMVKPDWLYDSNGDKRGPST